MKSSLKITAAAVLLALAFAPGRSWAMSSTTATLPVTASVTSGCLLGTVGVNFGAISPLVVEEDTLTGYTAQGELEVFCGTNGPTSGSGLVITLDNGANGAIAPILGIGTGSQPSGGANNTPLATRAMTNSTSYLAYDLFEPSIVSGNIASGQTNPSTNFSVPWTSLIFTSTNYNSLLSSGAFGAGGPGMILPIYGSIPGDQVQPLTPGVYNDTVNVSLSF